MSDLTEEQKGKVRALWSQLPEYCAHIKKTHSFCITELDLLLALTEATGEELKELALQEWSAESVANAITETTIVQALPIIAEEVVVMESVIPLNVIRNINEEHVKFKGEKWVVHKNDPDPFPSDPHAHNYEAGLKLHLGNGELYNGTKCVGKIPAKKFMELRSSFKSILLPPLCC